MESVGSLCKTLLAPLQLQQALKEIGESRHFRSRGVLFHAGDANRGVFLVCKGKVSLEMPGVRRLDRVFPPGSVLGLPATFTGNPYRLRAVSIGDCHVVQVSPERFLALMGTRGDLCEEATKLLSRELAFLLSAYGKYPRKLVVERQRTARHESETQHSEQPDPSSTEVDIPIICPVCWDPTIERVEGVRLSASNVAGKKVGGASVYRCSHRHLFALFKPPMTGE